MNPSIIAITMMFTLFKLDSLAINLNLTVNKGNIGKNKHIMVALLPSHTNPLGMMSYNITKCNITLELSSKLDLMN